MRNARALRSLAEAGVAEAARRWRRRITSGMRSDSMASAVVLRLHKHQPAKRVRASGRVSARYRIVLPSPGPSSHPVFWLDGPGFAFSSDKTHQGAVWLGRSSLNLHPPRPGLRAAWVRDRKPACGCKLRDVTRAP